MLRFHYAGQPGEGFGWGCCNKNLRRELGKLVELVEASSGSSRTPWAKYFPDVAFMPLVDHDFTAATPARGRVNFGYCFFESPLGPNAAANAARYDVVFCGSTWCLERMKERGITNGEVLLQGVDHEIFHPLTNNKEPITAGKSFRIFSGGKFEYRKGQDLVIAAFREFSRWHKEAHLVCSWCNPWPYLINTMEKSRIILGAAWDCPIFSWQAQLAGDQMAFFKSLLLNNSIRRDQFTILPKLPQPDLATAMHSTDIGLFPNRCEGGTNLVLMEYLACGKPAVANLCTGHADLKGADIIPIVAHEDPATHWAEQEVSEIVRALEAAYRARITDHRSQFTDHTPPPSPRWTWQAAAIQIIARGKEKLEGKVEI